MPDTMGRRLKMHYECGYRCGSEGSFRGFLTKEEKIEMLREYKDTLEKEAKGVAERIKDLERNN